MSVFLNFTFFISPQVLVAACYLDARVLPVVSGFVALFMKMEMAWRMTFASLTAGFRMREALLRLADVEPLPGPGALYPGRKKRRGPETAPQLQQRHPCHERYPGLFSNPGMVSVSQI